MADRQDNHGYHQIERQRFLLAVLAIKVADTEKLAACESLVEYYNEYTSNYTYRLEQKLVKVKEYLVIKEEDLVRAMIKRQA